MSVPKGEAHAAEISGDADDFLEIRMQDAGGTVAVLRRPSEVSFERTVTPARQFRNRLRLARAGSDWAVAATALSVSGVTVSEFGASEFAIAAIMAVIFPVVVALFGGYRRNDGDAELAPIAAGIGATAFGAAVVDASAGISVGGNRLLVLALLLVALEVLNQIVWSSIRRSSSVRRRVRLAAAVIVPAGDEEVSDVLSVLEDLDPVAIIDGPRLGSGSGASADRLGATVDRILLGSGADTLLVVDGSVPKDDLEELRRVARLHEADLRVILPVSMTLPGALHVQTVNGGYAMVHMPRTRLTRGALIAKRSMDLVLGMTAALITLPIMVAIGVAIKVTSRGPVLFRQERTTTRGKTFRIVKFRTMEADTDRSIADETAPFFKMTDDPRLTRVGRWIRPLSLDELPQLWNVLAGDMSLVGPRPLRVEQVQAHAELLAPRHDVAAGMTGWWQVNGRSDLPAEEAVVLDRFYIENWSIGLDLRILFKTIGVLFDRRGAY